MSKFDTITPYSYYGTQTKDPRLVSSVFSIRPSSSTTPVVYGSSGVFHIHKFSSSLVQRFSVIRLEPGETKNTYSDLKLVEKDKEEKRNMEPQDQFLQ